MTQSSWPQPAVAVIGNGRKLLGVTLTSHTIHVGCGWNFLESQSSISMRLRRIVLTKI